MPSQCPLLTEDDDFTFNITVPASHFAHNISVTFSPRKPRTASRPTLLSSPRCPLACDNEVSGSDTLTTSINSTESVTQLDSAATSDSILASPSSASSVPSHRRTNSSADYSVSPATRAAFPPDPLRQETGRKAWYVVGRGYDIGVFYDEWYVSLIYYADNPIHFSILGYGLSPWWAP